MRRTGALLSDDDTNGIVQSSCMNPGFGGIVRPAAPEGGATGIDSGELSVCISAGARESTAVCPVIRKAAPGWRCCGWESR